MASRRLMGARSRAGVRGSWIPITLVASFVVILVTERLTPRDGHPVNLVMFVVEAMMDPADLGWRFTSDPMPFFRGLRARFREGRQARAEYAFLRAVTVRPLYRAKYWSVVNEQLDHRELLRS